jgi:hypothetical protein
MKVTMTPRGYQSVQFVDQAGQRGIAEQSNEIDHGNPTWDRPGSSYLLLGRQEAPLQLSVEQVGELVEYLENWLDEGRFVRTAPEPVPSQ